MALPESVRRLIAAARRRLTVMWLVSGLVVALAVSGAAAALLLGLSRVTVILWAKPVAWGLIAVSAMFAVTAGFIGMPSRRRAALEVDRRLGGFDRVTTALELTAVGAELSPAEERAVRSAEAW
ncbi:MAG TPA: hypothetical protein VIW46_09295, partial [Acidimicrobiia bacterium]